MYVTVRWADLEDVYQIHAEFNIRAPNRMRVLSSKGYVLIETPNWLRPFLQPISALIGLGLGVFPELSVGLMVAVGATTLLERPRRESFDYYLEVGLFGLTIERMLASWRTSGQVWSGFLEGLIMWLVYRGAGSLNLLQRSWFMRALWIGLVWSVGMTVFSALQVFRAPRAWNGFNIVHVLPAVDTVRLVPPGDRETYSARYLDIQGPGRVDYEIELRSERPINIRIALNHSGTTPRAESGRCQLSSVWRICRIAMQLPDPGDLQFVIGGEHTWKADGPWIEARDGRFSGGRGLTSLQWRTLPRFSGSTLNPNLFAAWLSVISILLLLSPDRWIHWTSVPIGLVAVVLTGSRGSLLSIVIGVFAVAVFQNRSKLLPAILITGLIIAAVQTVSLPVRSMQITEGNEDRLIVYQNAFKAIFTSPILGVNNLKIWLKMQKLPNTASNLNKNPIHAHNLLLQILAESGIFGLSIWLTWWFLIFKRLLYRQMFSVFGVIATIILLNTVDMFFLYAPVHIVFWISILNQSSFIPGAQK
jgi:O-Antigen ligase